MNILKNKDYEYIYENAGVHRDMTLDEWTHAKDMYVECCEKLNKVLHGDTNIDSFEEYLDNDPEIVTYNTMKEEEGYEGVIDIWYNNNDPLIKDISVTVAYTKDEPPHITNMFDVTVKGLDFDLDYGYMGINEPVTVLRNKRDVLLAVYSENDVPPEYQTYTVKYPNNKQFDCSFETIKTVATTLANASENYEISVGYNKYNVDDMIDLLSKFNIEVKTTIKEK